ncbi:hypothetical protein RYH73_09215 [Olivibacter sp. CPCC 100613]|uniref:hypothetical protein n=1 Tax=Olivibacter sp. CPCC 100613 TaxID=3079931 RepID=UPI002FFC5109
MKKKLFILSLLIISSTFVFAQKIEISAGFGAPSLYGVTNDFGNALANIVLKNAESPNSFGALGVSALIYSKEEKWRYGLDVVSEFYTVKNTGYSKKSTLSIMPRTDYFWSGSDRKLRLYSGVSVGVYLNRGTIKNAANGDEKITDTIFGFNITPIGIRYGSQFAVFVEPNIGTKGIVQAGVSYRF